MRNNKTGPAMKHASTRQVFEYWNERRGNRSAPERGDIEPGPIRRALGDTFILAQDPRGDGYHFRLAGTRLCALFCRELKNTSFLKLWAPPAQSAMHDYLAAAVVEDAGFVAGVSGHNTGGASLELELLLLPLLHRDRSQPRLLGVLAPLMNPYWLGTRALEELCCGTIRYLGVAANTADAPRLVPLSDNVRLRHGLVVYDGGRS
jgi:hypothetical protein